MFNVFVWTWWCSTETNFLNKSPRNWWFIVWKFYEWQFFTFSKDMVCFIRVTTALGISLAKKSYSLLKYRIFSKLTETISWNLISICLVWYLYHALYHLHRYNLFISWQLVSCIFLHPYTLILFHYRKVFFKIGINKTNIS